MTDAGASDGVAHVAKRSVTGVLFGNWNADYSRENQRRMRYLQAKYIQSYQSSRPAESSPEDCIEPTSRLRMTANGKGPANPFHDVHAWDAALTMPSDLMAGHQGRWTASHARLIMGRMIEYQLQRRSRRYIPGVQSHGRANDCRNMFLEELKEWVKSYFTLESVRADELRRRCTYLAKVKMDDFHWCFPNEGSRAGEHNFHDVVDFVHEKLKEALTILEREERNRSMADMLKELNDHVTNAVEYGKSFLAYLLYAGPKRKAGADLLSSSRQLDRKTYATGKLLSLLDNSLRSQSTTPITSEVGESLGGNASRITSAAQQPPQQLLGGGAVPNPGDLMSQLAIMPGGGVGGGGGQLSSASMGASPSVISYPAPLYEVTVTKAPGSFALTFKAMYVIAVEGPVKGNPFAWEVKRSRTDFVQLWRTVDEDVPRVIQGRPPWISPTGRNEDDHHHHHRGDRGGGEEKKGGGGGGGGEYDNKDDEVAAECAALKEFLQEILRLVSILPPTSMDALKKFYDVDAIDVPAQSVIPSEQCPRVLSNLRDLLLTSKPPAGENEKRKGSSSAEKKKKPEAKRRKALETDAAARGIPVELAELEHTWGRKYAALIIETHALLQRLSLLLGWTREISQIFASMFGNALAFSRLPLKELLKTEQDLLAQSVTSYKELHERACALNAQEDYKWHRNLRAAEQLLSLSQHHTDEAIKVVDQLQREHLDEEIQRKRLLEVAEKFAFFMDRVDRFLPSIESDLQTGITAIEQEPCPTMPTSSMLMGCGDEDEGQGRGSGGGDRSSFVTFDLDSADAVSEEKSENPQTAHQNTAAPSHRKSGVTSEKRGGGSTPQSKACTVC